MVYTIYLLNAYKNLIAKMVAHVLRHICLLNTWTVEHEYWSIVFALARYFEFILLCPVYTSGAKVPNGLTNIYSRRIVY